MEFTKIKINIIQKYTVFIRRKFKFMITQIDHTVWSTSNVIFERLYKMSQVGD